MKPFDSPTVLACKLQQLLLTIFLILTLPFSTNAENPPEQLLVTATYLPIEPEQISSSVSVIDEQRLRAANKRNVLDMLREIPGITIERQGGPGGVTSVYLQGADPNLTLIMIDGIKVNDPLNSRGGSFDFNALNINTVKKIEVVRGPQSAIYGSAALAGVINIITHGASNDLEQRLHVEAGENSTHNINYRVSGSRNGLGYSVQLSENDGGDEVEGSRYEGEDINAKLGLQISENNKIQLGFRKQQADRKSFPESSGGPDFALQRDLDDGESQDISWSLNWQIRFHRHWRSSLEASAYNHEDVVDSPGVLVPLGAGFDYDVPPSATENKLDRHDWRWINTLGKVGTLWANVGIDKTRERSNSIGQLFFDAGGQFIDLPTDFRLDRENNGFFVNGNYKTSFGLLLNASARHDSPDTDSYRKTHNIGFRYSFNNNQTAIYGNWGEAFKLPGAFALGHALTGNADLLPEQANSWNLEIDTQLSSTMSLIVGIFDNEYVNLVDFDESLFKMVNRTSVDTSGAQFSLQYQMSNKLNIRLNGSYLDIDLKNSTSKLEGRPQWIAGTILQWSVNSNWQLNADYQWVDKRFASSTYPLNSIDKVLSAYDRIDMNIRWKTRPSLEVVISADNLLDESYEEAIGFTSPGRSFRLGAEYTY